MALRYYDIGTATHREPTQEEFDRYRELAAQYLALRKTLALLVRDHYSVKVYDGDQLRVQLSATSEVPEQKLLVERGVTGSARLRRLRNEA